MHEPPANVVVYLADAAVRVTGLAGINGKAGLEGTFLGPSIVTGASPAGPY